MKRLLLALVILSGGVSCLGTLHVAAVQLKREVAEKRQALTDETQALAQVKIQLRSVTKQVRELEQRLELEQAAAGSGPDEAEAVLPASAHLSASQSERLLAELGFNWASSDDYLVVSKDTLRAVSLQGMKGTKLSDAACQVLATTPDERAGIEGVTQGLMDSYEGWAEAHVQREEPSGNVVAKYTLPADPAFSESLSNSFASAVLTGLGTERGELLLDYARSWMLDLGMGSTGGENSLTVKRSQSGNEPHLNYELRYSGNLMNNEVYSPHQEFPIAFQPLFPNGWPDLAAREGFELPFGSKNGNANSP
jgi:hypothetical protein